MSVKDFKEGMIIGAKLFEEVYKKQEAAIRRVSEELGGKLDNIHSFMNVFIDDMNDLKRKELYDLNSSAIDLNSFEQEEKEFIVAGLYTLANQCKNNSPFQKAYLRSIQNYLGIKIPQIVIDISKISSVKDIDKQKAILQLFFEYLFLEKEDFTFLNEYSDSFINFSVNENDRETILQAILNIYKAVDVFGFIEKYGYFPEGNDSASNTSVELEDLVIDSILHIPAGTEKIYTSKKIILNADITCEGSLIFDKCLIEYNNETEGQIRLDKEAKMSMQYCTIICTDLKDEKYKKNLIKGDNCSNVILEYSSLYNCQNIGACVNLIIKHCIFKYNIFIKYKIEVFVSSKSSIMENCIIEYVNINNKEIPRISFGYFESVTACIFKNISGIFARCYLLQNNHFINCKNIIEGGCYLKADITDCLFEKCSYLFKFEYNVYSPDNERQIIKRCQFIDCSDSLIEGLWGSIEDCEFYNIKFRRSYKAGAIHIFGGNAAKENSFKPSFIINCLFDGVELKDNANLITCIMNNKIFKTIIGLKIENCKFKNCETNGDQINIINKTDIEYTSATIVSVINCIGLENINKEGNKADNIPIRYETGMGEAIGNRLDEITIGVPGFKYDFIIDDKYDEAINTNYDNEENNSSFKDEILNEIKSIQDLIGETLNVMENNKKYAEKTKNGLQDLLTQIKDNPMFLHNIPLENINGIKNELMTAKFIEKNEAVPEEMKYGIEEHISLMEEIINLWEEAHLKDKD